MSVQYSRRPFTVAEYDQMVEAGILREDDRVELIEGEIVTMSPIGRRHAACVRRLTRVLGRLLGERTLISVQNPIAIPDWSEPNPDVALLVPRSDDYASAHPGPRHIQVLIEVADTSLAYDTQVKAPVYARAGIREVWVIDLKTDRIAVHTRPHEGRYTRVRTYGSGERFRSQRFSGVEFSVKDLLP
jgi:Uma2 family endonuclease